MGVTMFCYIYVVSESLDVLLGFHFSYALLARPLHVLARYAIIFKLSYATQKCHQSAYHCCCKCLTVLWREYKEGV